MTRRRPPNGVSDMRIVPRGPDTREGRYPIGCIVAGVVNRIDTRGRDVQSGYGYECTLFAKIRLCKDDHTQPHRRVLLPPHLSQPRASGPPQLGFLSLAHFLDRVRDSLPLHTNQQRRAAGLSQLSLLSLLHLLDRLDLQHPPQDLPTRTLGNLVFEADTAP